MKKTQRKGLKKRTKRGGNKSRKWKPMNCHPAVSDKSVVKSSCFTVKTLQKIKEAYNKHHPNSPITIKEPYLLWHELKSRFSNCDKEDCWLEHLNDSQLKEEIDKMSFAPDHPPEWKKNPDEWLSNFDILEVLEQYQVKHPEFKFIGPTPMDFDSKPEKHSGKCVWDELCNFSLQTLDKKIEKIGIVFNLDKHNEPGSHWVSLYIDLRHRFMFYLDSAGDDVTPEVQKLVDRLTEQWKKRYFGQEIKFYKNHPFEHQMQNTECGMYALFFIISLVTQKIDGRHYSIEKLIKMFLSKRIPDKFVFNYRRIYFNTN